MDIYGIVVAMLGQCKDSLQAALCATYIHSQSAKLDIDSASFMPEDIINNYSKHIKKAEILVILSLIFCIKFFNVKTAHLLMGFKS